MLAGAERVFPVSRSLARLLQGSGVPAERVVVIYNGADLETAPSGAVEKTRASLGMRDEIIIGFLGFVRATLLICNQRTA